MRSRRASESQLITLIRNTLRTPSRAPVGIGDDAAVLRSGTILTTDAYADRVHFDSGSLTWLQVGLRCACAALSDIVAMGAEPEALVVALGLPRAASSARVRALYRGIARVCAKLGCELVGGDTIALDRLLLAVAATGRTDEPKLRSTARPGQRLYVTGFAGLAETGRRVLELRMPRRGYTGAVRRHTEPWPRQKVMRALRDKIAALTDTSDGIGTDALHLAEASRVRIVVTAETLSIHRETTTFCSTVGREPVEFALGAGEDYELLFTSDSPMPSSVAGVPVGCIGRVERGSGLYVERQGRIDKLMIRGYDHFA